MQNSFKINNIWLQGTKLKTIQNFLRNFSNESATVTLTDNKLYKLDSGPLTSVSLTKSDAFKYYELMSRVRRMETNLSKLYMERKIRGFCHLCSGQEAVCVGTEAALIPGDAIITSYRCHGFMVCRGAPVSEVMGELLGRTSGCVRGKGGSMHMYTDGFYGGNGIVGAQVPIGAGISLAFKRSGKNNLCVNFYGDGAANQGQVYETFNMAKLWNLPCIFVCENNLYGMGTSAPRASASVEFYKRAQYIPGVWVDGMNILSVREAIRFASEWCRSDKGPILLEFETYRYHGHSMSDPGKSYRTKEEVQRMRKERDPIHILGDIMTNVGFAAPEELKEIEKRVQQEVDEVQKKVSSDPIPADSEAFLHVVKQNTPMDIIRGCDITQWIKPQ